MNSINNNLDKNKQISVIKAVDKKNAEKDEELIYTIIVINTGNTSCYDGIFNDTNPIGTEFINESVSVNGINKPSEIPEQGINLGDIGINSIVTIQFKVKVIMNSGIVQNMAYVEGDFLRQDETKEKRKFLSNLVNTDIKTGELEILKKQDKSIVKYGDVITYTIIVNNKGSIKSQNTILREAIPIGTEFINGSVDINGVNQSELNPNNMIGLGNINIGKKSVIKFKVQVMIEDGIIENQAKVESSFFIVPEQVTNKQFRSNKTEVIVKGIED